MKYSVTEDECTYDFLDMLYEDNVLTWGGMKGNSSDNVKQIANWLVSILSIKKEQIRFFLVPHEMINEYFHLSDPLLEGFYFISVVIDGITHEQQCHLNLARYECNGQYFANLVDPHK